MAQALRSPSRNLCWLAWFETAGDPYTHGRDAADCLGRAHVHGRRHDLLGLDGGPGRCAELATAFALNGLPGEAAAGMDESVKGRQAKLWLGALNGANQIMPTRCW